MARLEVIAMSAPPAPADPRVVAIPWYRADTYLRVRAAMADPELMPPSFDAWLQRSEQAERQLRREGCTVVRALIELEALQAHCRHEGLACNAQGRASYANWVARGRPEATG